MFGMKRSIVLLAGVLAVAAVVALAGAWQLQRYLNTPLDVPEGGLTFEILPGTAFSSVSRNLTALNVLQHPRLLNGYVRWSGKAQRVRAGEYYIAEGVTPNVLLDMFISGAVKMHSFTIVEGWTYREMLVALANNDAVEHTVEYEDWPAVLESLSTDYQHPEGLFLPETYHFPRHTPDTELLKQAFDAMQVVLQQEWDGRDLNLPIKTPYEALILASIIEKETALAEERPRISGVFVRRLQSRMRLQTDPTVIYGIGEGFDGNLTRKHLRTDTTYNTYTRHGLPPTPIALPGKAAIAAAVHPQAGTEVYFVATGLGDGSHQFSSTKQEHDAAVREYLARQRATRKRD